MNMLGRTLLIAMVAAGSAGQVYAQDQAVPAGSLPLPSVPQEKPTLAPATQAASLPPISAPAAPAALPPEIPQPAASANAVTSAPLPLPGTSEALPLPGDKPVVSSIPAPPIPPAQPIPAPEPYINPAGTEPGAQAPDQKAQDNTAAKADDKKLAKHHKKHKAKLASSAPYHYVPIKDRLPHEIYAKSYPKNNRHLPIAQYEKDYDNLLFAAARNNNTNGIRSIMKTGRTVDMVNDAGDTPLLVAVRNDSVNATRLLLARNADVTLKDRNGNSAMDIAQRVGDPNLVQALKDGPVQY